jgi:hypothetical protein
MKLDLEPLEAKAGFSWAIMLNFCERSHFLAMKDKKKTLGTTFYPIQKKFLTDKKIECKQPTNTTFVLAKILHWSLNKIA